MTKKEVIILVAEDDDAHAVLIEKNLRRAGIANELRRFADGQEVLDFLTRTSGVGREPERSYLLLLDIKMPRKDGFEVLRLVKADPELKKLPIIMLTATDDPREIERCYALGCNSYITKPVCYEKFVEAVRRLGMFMLVMEVPVLDRGRGSASRP
ncbi:MAG: response regulator [candidate division WOR-3 bacterium]